MQKNPRGFGHADFFVPLPPLLSEIRLMKHRVHTLFVPLAFVLGLVSCDRIDDPVEGIIETIDETYDIPAMEPLDTDVQRVLIVTSLTIPSSRSFRPSTPRTSRCRNSAPSRALCLVC